MIPQVTEYREQRKEERGKMKENRGKRKEEREVFTFHLTFAAQADEALLSLFPFQFSLFPLTSAHHLHPCNHLNLITLRL